MDEELRGNFHTFFKKLYKSVIVPDYMRGNRRYFLSYEIARMFSTEENADGKQEKRDIYKEIKKMETFKKAKTEHKIENANEN